MSQKKNDYPKRVDIFAKGSEPTQVDDFHVVVEVCEDDQTKLATDYHKDKGLTVNRTFIYLNEILDSWQSYTDSWMNSRRDDGYGKAPTEKCEIRVGEKVVKGPVIEITSPAQATQITDGKVRISAAIYTTDRITKVEFYWDDYLLLTSNSEPFELTYDISKLAKDYYTSGTHTINVTAYDSQGQENTVSTSVGVVLPEPTATPTPKATPVPTATTVITSTPKVPATTVPLPPIAQ